MFGKLLNYAFRRDGGMSWNALRRGWSKEVEQGLENGVKVEGWEVSVALGGRGFRVVDMQSREVRWEMGWARGSWVRYGESAEGADGGYLVREGGVVRWESVNHFSFYSEALCRMAMNQNSGVKRYARNLTPGETKL